ncbi:hypothetical protein QS257_07000 [Terrilactibacillus sp. S3-3]|nr:hypothetical protein QS257_07000 [Terrilactibacillus sp. S3-3]
MEKKHMALILFNWKNYWKHYMNNGGMFAAREMRKGLEEIIEENNKALMASVKEMIKESQKKMITFTF